MPKRQNEKKPSAKPAKKKKAEPDDQPLLPFDCAPATPARPDMPARPVAEPIRAAAPPAPPRRKDEKVHDEQAPLAVNYRNWFLDYASYVILDRAVPHIDDGLKPVQRRVLHTLWDMDDGRFHKVAN